MTLTVESSKNLEQRDQIADWVESLRAPFLSRIESNDDFGQFGDTARECAIEKRCREFSQGRRCAESLLKRMGNGEQVWKNPDRSPAWPIGFAGSISHSENWTWTSVGRKAKVGSIGIDTEGVVSRETLKQVSQEIAADSEWKLFNQFDLSQEQIFSIVFSAKEAFFKCCYPIVKQYFGFEHATVIEASSNQLRIQTHAAHPALTEMPSILTVHFLATPHDVFTITWMEPAQ